MAFRDVFDKVKDQVTRMTGSFFHGEEAYPEQAYGYSPQEAEYAPPQASYNPAGQPEFQPTPTYEGSFAQQVQGSYQQQAQQAAYEPQPQSGYQSPYAGSFAQQAQPAQPRAGRVNTAAPGQSPQKVVPFPGTMTDGAGRVFAHETQVLQMRDRDECKSIIEHLKNNSTVVMNMDSIANDTEKQRCVDMLSGAAYTLGCQISRISPRGVYLITPASVRVELDEATRRMNGGARPAAARPSRAHSYAGRPSGQPTEEAGYEAPEAPAYGNYQQLDYQPSPYSGDGEYQSASYQGSDVRYAAGYGQGQAYGTYGR